MSIIQMLIAQMFNTPPDVGDIGHSLRFRSSASAYLSRTFGSPTSSSVFTLSLWVKRGGLTGTFRLFGASTTTYLTFNSSDQLNLTLNGVSACTSTAVFRDPTAHYHIVYQQNGSAQTLYVNGVSVATGTTAAAIFNTAIAHQLGAANTSNYLDGYMSRVCLVDGQALTPSSFGYFNTEINEWVSNSQSTVKAVVDAGGTNSFMLDFDNGTSTTTLGYDKSSKGNNWTCNNISLTAGVTYDWMLDVPGNNYATLNPLRQNGSGVFASGNLAGTSESATSRGLCSTIALGYADKWYMEWTPASSATTWFGVTANTLLAADLNTAGQKSVLYYANGTKWVDGVNSAYGSSYTTQTIGIAFDGPAGTVTFYRDNVSQGAITLPSSSVAYVFCMGNAGGGGVTNTANFGQRPFTYTPPTDFLALNQANLSASGTVIVLGSFTGNANANGPFVWMNGVPDTLTINGNAVTFGTHADKLANGFKLRTSSASYNVAGSNTWTATITSDTKNIFKYNTAEGNP